jgi:Na+/proline symporter
VRNFLEVIVSLMKRSRFAGLRSRLIALVLLAVLPALGLILFTASEERKAAATEVQDDALRIARLASSAQERLIEGARQLLIMMAHLPAVSGGRTVVSRPFTRNTPLHHSLRS